MDQIWIEPYQIGRIGRANLRNSRGVPLLQFLADRHALEESFERHFLVDLRENVLVRAEGITDPAHACLYPSFAMRLAVTSSMTALTIRYQNAPTVVTFP